MWGEKIQIAMPMTVIADTERITALYLAAGSPIKNKSTYRSDHLPIGEWEIVHDVWRDDLIRIKYAGDAHAYYAMWKGDRFHRWYINLESAYERTPVGVDFTDRILDIVVLPDLAGWRWKDEDELTRAVALGLVTQTQADSFYAGRQTGNRTAGDPALTVRRRLGNVESRPGMANPVAAVELGSNRLARWPTLRAAWEAPGRPGGPVAQAARSLGKARLRASSLPRPHSRGTRYRLS